MIPTQLKWRLLLLAPLFLLSTVLVAPLLAAAEPAEGESSALEAAAGEAEEVGVSNVARGTFLASLTVFMLAVFVGFEVITKVPPTLHTPLMSGANAISGVTLVGAVLAVGYDSIGPDANPWKWFVIILGFLAVILATINVVGGFMVTGRMLAMFKKKR